MVDEFWDEFEFYEVFGYDVGVGVGCWVGGCV